MHIEYLPKLAQAAHTKHVEVWGKKHEIHLQDSVSIFISLFLPSRN